MNDAFQDALKEAFAIAPSNVVILDTLELIQEGVQDPVRLVRSPVGITAIDENGFAKDYEPAGFQLSLPESNDQGVAPLGIAIDNIGRRVSDWINRAKSQMVPVQCIYRPYLNTDLFSPQMNPPLLMTLQDIVVTDYQVTGKAIFMDIVNKKFPNQLYTRARFPSLG